MAIKNKEVSEFTSHFANECKQRKYMLKRYEQIKNRKYLSSEGSAELELLEKRINNLDKMMNRISDPSVRGIITNLWIDKMSKAKVARMHNVSESEVYYAVNRACKKLYQSLD